MKEIIKIKNNERDERNRQTEGKGDAFDNIDLVLFE